MNLCKSYNKSIIALPLVGQYGEIFSSLVLYCPSLRSGLYYHLRAEYFPILPTRSCNNIYLVFDFVFWGGFVATFSFSCNRFTPELEARMYIRCIYLKQQMSVCPCNHTRFVLHTCTCTFNFTYPFIWCLCGCLFSCWFSAFGGLYGNDRADPSPLPPVS